MNSKAITLLICTLMVFSTATSSNAQTSTDTETNAQGQDESSIWGITYDWSHFEGDAFNMTGIDVNELNLDLKEAASYAGFDLDYDQVLSGTTQVFVESWEDAGPFTVTTDDGDSHQVGKRITELTIRHGSLADTGMATNWSDGDEKIDAWISAYQDYLLVMNANYVEYVDENMFVYGGEILLDTQFTVSLGFEAELGVTAASETISPDISANMELSFEIPELEATWTPYYALDYHFVMGSEPSQDSGGSHTYCSNEEFQTYQMCRDAELEDGETKFIQHHEQSSVELVGTFSSVMGYSMDLSAAGLPTDEFDVDIDVFNVALSDSIPHEGMIINPEMHISSYALWGHNCPTVSNSEVVVVDGVEYQAQCGLVLPVPWAMTDMMENSIEQAFESSVQELGDVALAQAEEWIEEAGLEDDPYEDAPDFTCDDGQTIPRNWFNDGYEDCYDGSDEITWADNDPVQDYENPYEMPTEFPVPTEGSTLHQVLDSGELTYCTDPFYPPFESYDDNGMLVGFDVDVADSLASALSDEYDTAMEFVDVESAWDPIIYNLNNEYCDAIISAITKTDEREEMVDFTRGYYSSSQGVIGGDGSPSVDDVMELDHEEITIGVQEGTLSDMFAMENLHMADIYHYDHLSEAIEALDNGDVMYVLGDSSPLSLEGEIMTTFSEEFLAIAVREGNNELLSALNVAITNLVESDHYETIYSTWFEGESQLTNDWSPDWDFYWQESDGPGNDGFTCIFEDWQTIPSSGVGDGYPDCHDGSDEEVEPEIEIWSCFVDVRVDSLADTSWDSFEDKINEHPGFPEWCGIEVGELEIGETDPNLPPPDDVYASLIDDGQWSSISGRNSTHWHEYDYSIEYCLDVGGTWSEAHQSCVFEAAPHIGIDGELIQDEEGWSRYHWSGDYLYVAIPTSDEPWTRVGPRITDFICDNDDQYDRVQEWQVGDGTEDCENGNDEDPDAVSGQPSYLDRMAEALEESNLERTLEDFSDRLEMLLEDNVPEEPKYDLEDLCATMLWDVSEVRVLGFALVLEGGLLFGPQIDGTFAHPSTTINVEFLTGQAARDAKSGISSKVSLDEMAPESNHDLDDLRGILGLDPLPDEVVDVGVPYDEEVVESDGNGDQDNLDSGEVNNVTPVIDETPANEDPEATTPGEEAESSSLPANGLIASLSVIAAAAMLIPRRDD